MPDDADAVLYVPLKVRRDRERQVVLRARRGAAAAAADDDDPIARTSSLTEFVPERSTRSLVDVSNELHAARGAADSADDAEHDRERLLTANLIADRGVLQSHSDRAAGVQGAHRDVMTSSWRPPARLTALSADTCDRIRAKHRIAVEGEAIAPPCERFRDMRLPRCILEHLARQGIRAPTPIQLQGLPVVLARRDMIGIAFTGSGKTLAFCVPMVLWALEAEMRLALAGGEGPVGLVVCPSRELAQQTYDIVRQLIDCIGRSREFARRCAPLNALLCIGGIDMRQQMDSRRNPIHVVVATPGRLMDMLGKRALNLDNCTFLCLDEADRMIDLGFDENIRTILGHFRPESQRQTVMFSATMPAKIKEFATTSLVSPIVVNVGRAGAANLRIIQCVEYVKEESRIVYLLDCLQKTPPPVLIFCSNIHDVDEIEEYLLIKGVEAVSIHGGKAQADRQAAVAQFKNGAKDVLVATDIASKGLDFPDIQHVINFDMPSEIEDYVHRIGRTGRRGKTGTATTFINRSSNETTLLDLKHLLMEAKQKIPPVLMTLHDPSAGAGSGGCSYCGGLGHRVTDCPKYMGHVKEKVKVSMGGGQSDDRGGY